MAVEILIQIIIGISAGGFISAGLFTFIVTLGIITRLIQVSHTAKQLHLYENAVILGAITGTCFYSFSVHLALGTMGVFIFGLFAGIFTGCLVGAVAEILDAFPIFFRRLHLHQGVKFVVVVLAVGKLIGVLIQYFG